MTSFVTTYTSQQYCTNFKIYIRTGQSICKIILHLTKDLPPSPYTYAYASTTTNLCVNQCAVCLVLKFDTFTVLTELLNT